MVSSRTPSQLPDVEAQAIAASHGDMDALGELYERYADPLLRYILPRTQNNLTLAEDLAATTWERVARAMRTYETRGSGFPGWLFTVGRRTVAEHYRIRLRHAEHLDGEMLTFDQADTGAGPDAILERKIRSHEVAAAVRGLVSSQRQCVTLRFFAGLSLKETGVVMGKTPNAVKQLQHRALNVLHQRHGNNPCHPRASDTFGPATEQTTDRATRDHNTPQGSRR